MKALQLLDEDDVLRRCADGGQRMLDALEDVRARYPQVIEEVRGRGMMVGIQLRDQSEGNSHILRMLSQQGHLGYTAAAYMLNVHDIRLAPTLTQPFTLRLEPSAYVTPSELQRTADGIEMLCRAIAVAGSRAPDGLPLRADRTGRRLQPAARARGRANGHGPRSVSRSSAICWWPRTSRRSSRRSPRLEPAELESLSGGQQPADRAVHLRRARRAVDDRQRPSI